MKKKTLWILGVILAALLIGGAVVLFGILMPRWRQQKEHSRMIAEYFSAKLEMYQVENEGYADYEVDVAFLGDSLTDGCDLTTYYPQYKTANRGIGGETTIGLEERMQVSVYDLKPKVVVMLIGANNLDSMFTNYEKLLQGLKNNLPQTKVILVSLTPMGEGWAERNPLAAYNNVKIRKLADTYGFAFVDVFTPLLDETTDQIRKEYTIEGLHLTAKGYEVMRDVITPAIDEALAQYGQ